VTEPLAERPLALALLALVAERPMYPHQMRQVVLRTHLEDSVRLSNTSIANAIRLLLKDELIVVSERSPTSSRPERTEYTITPAGRDALLVSLRRMIAEPAKEFPRFQTALALIPLLDRGEALALLRTRIDRLTAEVDQDRQVYQRVLQKVATPALVIDFDHSVAMRQAEAEWAKRLLTAIETGEMEWSGRLTDVLNKSIDAKAGEPTPVWYDASKGRKRPG
jgi:DNA-binding PadR family transcriptional regulator